MSKKVVFSIMVLVVALGLADTALGHARWRNYEGDQDFSRPDNWADPPNLLGGRMIIDGGPNNPSKTVLPPIMSYTPDPCYAPIDLQGPGWDAGTASEWYITGGSLRVGDDGWRMCWEADTTGYTEMTGGNLIFDGDIYCPYSDSGTATVLLHGGTIHATGVQFKTGGLIDLAGDGKLVLDSNDLSEVETWIDDEQLTADGGLGELFVEYDEVTDTIIITASNKRAWRPQPQNDSQNICPDAVLSWTPGDNAADVNGHDVYFGTNYGDVDNADTSTAGIYKGRQDGNSYPESGTLALDLGKTYYWRIDEVNGVDTWKGSVWQLTTNDGSAFNPNPYSGEATVPRDVVVEWSAGCLAESHHVFFGTDFNDVNDATSSSHANVEYAHVYINQFDPNGGGNLDYLTEYYWRVDANSASETWRGQVWNFRTESAIVDPNLRLWYKFDGTGGDIVYDSSGREFHSSDGTVSDRWEPNEGRFGGSLWCNEDIGLTVSPHMLDITNGITVSVWLKDAYRSGDDNIVFGASGDDYELRADVPEEGGQIVWRAGNDTNDVLEWNLDGADPSRLRGWHHWGFVKNDITGEISIYLDGRVAKSANTGVASLGNLAGKAFKVGTSGSGNTDLVAHIDDFRVYDYAMSAKQVGALFRGADLEKAWAPIPFDNQTSVPWDVNLTWLPGDYAVEHKVFFGGSWDDVNDMTDPCATLDLGEEEYDPGLLELKGTYYWRVDEVNGPNTWKGAVWRFTVADFIMLDDFEQYDTGDNSVQYTWYDQYSQELGELTGAWLELARSPKPVHGGNQALSYTYDTDDPWADLYYAEAWLPLEEIGGFQDWTSEDVRLLTLFFHGQATNDANETEQMYVAVEDTLGTYAEMRYGDNEGEALSDLKVEEWQRWDIPFVYFGDSNFAAVADDVDFSSIRNVYIGFGNRRTPAAAGKGIVYFDDLRLSMPFCKPEFKPIGDLNGDCFVGVADIGEIGEQWLRGDVNVNPVTEPPTSDPNLVAHWKLDGDTTDSSANAYHGTAEGAHEWVAGKDGQAIDLAGGWVVVDDNGVTPKLRMKHYVSVMAWVYIEDPGADTKVVIKGEDNQETFGLEVDSEDGAAFIFRDANNLSDVLSVNCGYALQSNEWVHIAGTYDQNEQVVYVNGAVEDSNARGAIELFTDPNDGLGIGGRYGDGADFDGRIDDVRVYDRAVTRAEIGYIACGSDGMCPLQSEANFYSGEDAEIINFRDFAKLFEYWGDEELWPPQPVP
ncbi:MAG TPA: LamG domain-containing protein [Sedimentisphaerales bacterium]|nr:LamG domain-containing protein [Sedimentisphaerales bacterium]